MTSVPVVRVAASLVWGVVVAVAAYAIMRTAQALTSPAQDPAAVVWSAHAGFFWRAWTASYVGGMAALTAYVVARGRLEGAARGLAPAIVLATAILALATVLFP